MKRIFLVIVIAISISPITAPAQDEARAAWQITNFDVTASVQERTLSAVAVLSATNVGRGAGTSFTFRISNKAVIKTASIGSASANFRTVPETYGGLQRITVTLASPVASGGQIAL